MENKLNIVSTEYRIKCTCLSSTVLLMEIMGLGTIIAEEKCSRYLWTDNESIRITRVDRSAFSMYERGLFLRLLRVWIQKFRWNFYAVQQNSWQLFMVIEFYEQENVLFFARENKTNEKFKIWHISLTSGTRIS